MVCVFNCAFTQGEMKILIIIVIALSGLWAADSAHSAHMRWSWERCHYDVLT